MGARILVLLSVVTAWLACPAEPPPPPPPPSPPELTVVEVIAGATSRGVFDGVGEAARFNGPAGIGHDGARVLVSDTFSVTLRTVEPSTGAVATWLRAPEVVEPRGVTGGDGVVYLGDATCVRALPGDGSAGSVLAGDCYAGGYLDGDSATARFEFLLHDLELDTTRGALYVSDRLNDAIRAVDLASGAVSTLAGGAGTGSDDGIGAAARFDGPGGLALDEGAGVLYVADTFNHTVRAIELASATVTTVAGVAGDAGGADGPVASARFDMPQGVALAGRTLVAGGFDGTVRALDLDAAVVTTPVRGLGGTFASPLVLPGTRVVVWMDLADALLRIDLDAAADVRVSYLAGPKEPLGFVDGAGAEARFVTPVSLVVDDDGRTAYLTDLANHALRVVDLQNRTVRTLVGGPMREGDRDGALDVAEVSTPTGLALDAAARMLYIADAGNQKIRAVDLEAGAVTTLAGSGAMGGDDGDAADASFADPWELALAGGALYVADSSGASVRKVDLGTGEVSTLAGRYGEADHIDGAGADARFRVPVGLAAAGDALFVADYEAHTIRRVALEDGTTTTLLGTDGVEGAVGGPADFAALSLPTGLTASADGTLLYGVEEGGHVLREIVIADGSSRLLVGDGVAAGGLPTGVPVPIADATLLEPQDVAVAGDALVIVADGAVWLARP
ncbi:MAG: hypothetical protein HYS27_12100 [Deltaproteobacteria bacterium]|nr:hypothetical protein [Deltaproteobacteria bacterium]